ncbi:transposase [Pelagibaca abyssi]|nr:transposase [Salipiger abyssi]
MNLTDPMFTDKDAAREYLEATRWADGVYCPHCGGAEKCKKLEGKSHRPSLYQCGDCRKQFTVTVAPFSNALRCRSTSGCWPPSSWPRPRRAFRPTNCTAPSVSLTRPRGSCFTAPEKLRAKAPSAPQCGVAR